MKISIEEVNRLLYAAKLVENSLEPEKQGYVETLDKNGVQAFLTNKGELIIDGTNEVSDMFKYNFQLLDFSDDSDKFAAAIGDSGKYAWHAGFLEYAYKVYNFIKNLDERPKLLIGHSLGAAAAQIIGPSMNIESICFASPRPLLYSRRVGQPENAERVINVLRNDDLVCKLPPSWLGYKHVGRVLQLNPSFNFGEDHKIDNYIDALKEFEIKNF